MSKAVLISIRPKWCELIASGKKTIEVRKTAPKIKTPFKGYIYCTKDPGNKGSATHFFESDEGTFWSDGKTFAAFLSGTVIGEFMCDKIYKFSTRVYLGGEQTISDEEIVSKSCVSRQELRAYEGQKQGIFGLHISDLVIYDEPKKLTDFIRPSGGCCNEGKCTGCKYLDKGNGYNVEDDCLADFDTDMYSIVTRPPQSWCYVEG